MSRLQIPGLGDIGLRPNASPVDTFVAPDVTKPARGPSSFEQLASSMSSISPAFAQLSLNRKAEQDKQDAQQALLDNAQKFRADTSKQLRDLVKSGVIPESASPAYVQSLVQDTAKREFSKWQSSVYEEFKTATDKSGKPLSQSDDSTAVREFFQSRVDQAVQGRSLYEAEVWLPQTSEFLERSVMQHRRQREQDRPQEYQANLENMIVGDMSGLTTLDPDFNTKIGALSDKWSKDLKDRGMVVNFTDLNKWTTDAVVNAAVEGGDIEIARRMLGKISTGSGDLAGTAYARQKMSVASEIILNREVTKANRLQNQESIQRRADKAQVLDLLFDAEMSGKGLGAVVIPNVGPDGHRLDSEAIIDAFNSAVGFNRASESMTRVGAERSTFALVKDVFAASQNEKTPIEDLVLKDTRFRSRFDALDGENQVKLMSALQGTNRFASDDDADLVTILGRKAEDGVLEPDAVTAARSRLTPSTYRQLYRLASDLSSGRTKFEETEKLTMRSAGDTYESLLSYWKFRNIQDNPFPELRAMDPVYYAQGGGKDMAQSFKNELSYGLLNLKTSWAESEKKTGAPVPYSQRSDDIQKLIDALILSRTGGRFKSIDEVRSTVNETAQSKLPGPATPAGKPNYSK